MDLLQLYSEAKALGLATAFVIVLVYLHALMTFRPVLVRCVAILEALRIKAGIGEADIAMATALAESEVPRPEGAVSQLAAGLRVVVRGGTPAPSPTPSPNGATAPA